MSLRRGQPLFVRLSPQRHDERRVVQVLGRLGVDQLGLMVEPLTRLRRRSEVSTEVPYVDARSLEWSLALSGTMAESIPHVWGCGVLG